ncbi:MAG: hypothetical protein ACLTTO_15455 [Lachnospiraceae bacterium]
MVYNQMVDPTFEKRVGDLKKSFPSAQKNYPALTGRIFWKKKRRKMLIGGCSISWQMP